MKNISAGILAVRKVAYQPEFFLAHPGGPFFKNKDKGAWSIPKGLPDEGEELIEAAQREFTEETGFTLLGPFYDLGQTKLKSGKKVFAWAALADFDARLMQSNTFPLEWPPKSGKTLYFPEADQGDWFDYNEAAEKVNPALVIFLDKALQIG